MKIKIFVVKTTELVIVNQTKKEIIWENKYGYIHLLKSYINELQHYDIFFDADLSKIKKIAEQYIYKTHDHGFLESDSYNDVNELWEELKAGDLQKLYSVDYAKNRKMAL